MDYIEKTLGELVIRHFWDGIDNLPYYLHSAYQFSQVTIGIQKCIFIVPQGELGTISAIKKHIRQIKSECDYPIVLELQNLSHQRKETLIKEKIPFVVLGKQLYLPFMGIALQEKYDNEKAVNVEKLSPSSQVLLFLFIYGKNEPLYLNKISLKLGFKPMRVTRAAIQLLEAGLLETYKKGVQKVLTSPLTPKELFDKAKPFLINPVRRKIFINKTDLQSDYFLAGESALSEKTMLNFPKVYVYGTTKIPKKMVEMQFVDSEMQCILELWRYDPTKFYGTADVLSLAISLGSIRDERVEIAIEEMLENLWKGNE
ncbi:MAG: MarR family transcriptional regulator [Lachnospiraceae bacterium]|nr:MarR family transcriptional regulator [Lachnospiraceae bacterium]